MIIGREQFMKKTMVLLGILLIAGTLGSACATKSYSREDLVSLMDRYITALIKHDPSGLPLAEDVKLVENTKITPVGEGLWETVTGGTNDYRIYVADPVQGQVGFMGVVEDRGKPIQLGVRLKVAGGEIKEIDHMVWLIDGPLPDGLKKPRPGLIQKLDPSEKVSREEMLAAANSYYDAIEFSDGNIAPFAEECQRREGGITSANNQDPPPPDAEETPFGAMAMFGRMKCGEQLSTGIMGYITKINQRRLFAVDEEMGLVMAFTVFNHDGEPNPLPIRNVPGMTESPNTWRFTCQAGHIFKIRNGKIYEIEAMAAVHVPKKTAQESEPVKSREETAAGETSATEPIPYLASDGWSCTRECLVEKMDLYLDSLARNDPSGAPLAADVVLVENAEKTPVGEGLWKTATGGPTDFKITVADPDTGEVAFMGVIEENNKPTIAGIRLKVVDHQIKEIDHLVIHNESGDPLNPNMSHVRPALLERLPKLERVHRDKMREIANSYYEAILQNDGTVAPFAEECERRENGGITANDRTQTPEEAAKDEFSIYRKMKCTEQLSTGCMDYITDITDRRVFAVDEEMGLVFAFSIFRHSGEPGVMKIVGVPGVTERANTWGAFELPAAHVFKIRSGKIHEIEAIGYFVEGSGLESGWE